MNELMERMNVGKVRGGRWGNGHYPHVKRPEEPAKQPKRMNATLHSDDKIMESFFLARRVAKDKNKT